MESFAERYEAVLVPVIFRPWARELVRRVAPRDGERVLDLVCGTGVLTREVASSGFSPGGLTGVDLSRDMLGVARNTAAKIGFEAEWIEASAEELPFPDDRFDVAFCQQALQFFPDRPGPLRELHRVVKTEGRVAFCVQRELSSNPLLRSQAAVLDKYVGSEAGDAVRAICSLPDANELRTLFDGAGFSSIEIESVSLSLHHPDGKAFAVGAMGGMHTGDKLSQMSEAQRQRCEGDFLTGLGDCFDEIAIRFPHVSHVSHVITARA